MGDRITRWNAEGRSGLYAGARHYLRLLRSLVKKQVPYLAPAGRARSAAPEEFAAAAQDTWKVMQDSAGRTMARRYSAPTLSQEGSTDQSARQPGAMLKIEYVISSAPV